MPGKVDQNGSAGDDVHVEPAVHHKGVYKNVRFLHTTCSLMGLNVRLKTTAGKEFEGILRAFSEECEIALESVHEVDDSPLYPSRDMLLPKMIFKQNDLLYLTAITDMAGITKGGFATDADISAYCSRNGELTIFDGGEKEFEVWQPDEDDEDDVLEDYGVRGNYSSSGWNAEEMFRHNEQIFGVETDYDPSNTQYTTVVVNHEEGTEEYRLRAERARRIADEINKNPASRAAADLENDDDERDLEGETAKPQQAPTAGGNQQPPPQPPSNSVDRTKTPDTGPAPPSLLATNTDFAPQQLHSGGTGSRGAGRNNYGGPPRQGMNQQQGNRGGYGGRGGSRGTGAGPRDQMARGGSVGRGEREFRRSYEDNVQTGPPLHSGRGGARGRGAGGPDRPPGGYQQRQDRGGSASEPHKQGMTIPIDTWDPKMAGTVDAAPPSQQQRAGAAPQQQQQQQYGRQQRGDSVSNDVRNDMSGGQEQAPPQGPPPQDRRGPTQATGRQQQQQRGAVNKLKDFHQNFQLGAGTGAVDPQQHPRPVMPHPQQGAMPQHEKGQRSPASMGHNRMQAPAAMQQQVPRPSAPQAVNKSPGGPGVQPSLLAQPPPAPPNLQEPPPRFSPTLNQGTGSVGSTKDVSPTGGDGSDADSGKPQSSRLNPEAKEFVPSFGSSTPAAAPTAAQPQAVVMTPQQPAVMYGAQGVQYAAVNQTPAQQAVFYQPQQVAMNGQGVNNGQAVAVNPAAGVAGPSAGGIVYQPVASTAGAQQQPIFYSVNGQLMQAAPAGMTNVMAPTHLMHVPNSMAQMQSAGGGLVVAGSAPSNGGNGGNPAGGVGGNNTNGGQQQRMMNPGAAAAAAAAAANGSRKQSLTASVTGQPLISVPPQPQPTQFGAPPGSVQYAGQHPLGMVQQNNAGARFVTPFMGTPQNTPEGMQYAMQQPVPFVNAQQMQLLQQNAAMALVQQQQQQQHNQTAMQRQHSATGSAGSGGPTPALPLNMPPPSLPPGHGNEQQHTNNNGPHPTSGHGSAPATPNPTPSPASGQPQGQPPMQMQQQQQLMQAPVQFSATPTSPLYGAGGFNGPPPNGPQPAGGHPQMTFVMPNAMAAQYPATLINAGQAGQFYTAGPLQQIPLQSLQASAGTFTPGSSLHRPVLQLHPHHGANNNALMPGPIPLPQHQHSGSGGPQ